MTDTLLHSSKSEFFLRNESELWSVVQLLKVPISWIKLLRISTIDHNFDFYRNKYDLTLKKYGLKKIKISNYYRTFIY